MADTGDAAFTVEYEEPVTKHVRKLVLCYWERSKELSLWDCATRRTFLKRTQPPENVELRHLYVGATVVIAARPYRVVGFADAATQRKLGTARGSSVVLTLPEAYHAMGKVVLMLQRAGLAIGRLRMVRFSADEALEFLQLGAAAGGAPASPEAAAALSREHLLAIECTGEDVVARVHEAVGPADPAVAREAAPRSVRAVLGLDRARNAVRASACAEAAAAEVRYLFERPFPYTAVCTHCTAVVVKPHAVEAGLVGTVLDALLAQGLEVSAVRSVALTRGDAADFLECYKGVVPECERWVTELSSGPCVALEVRGEGVVERVRELFGPYDVAVARVLRPHTLRAQHGVDNVRCVAHVTDVEVDGPLESKFLFKVV